MNREALLGYKEAVEELKYSMNASILRNGGAVEMEQVLSVFNDMIYKLHSMTQEVDELLEARAPREESVEEQLERIILGAFPDLQVKIIKGGY